MSLPKLSNIIQNNQKSKSKQPNMPILAILLTLTLLLPPTTTTITHQSTYTPQISRQKATTWSWTSSGSIFASILSAKKKYEVQIVMVGNGSNYVASKVAYGVKFDNSFRLRVMEGFGVTGPAGAAGDQVFLVFDAVGVRKFWGGFATEEVLFTAGGLMEVVDCGFWNRSQQVFILLKNSTNYILKLLNGTSTTSDTLLLIAPNSTFIKSETSQQTILLLFNIGILIYQPTQNTSILIQSIPHPSPSLKTSLSTLSTSTSSPPILTYSYNKQLHLLNLNPNPNPILNTSSPPYQPLSQYTFSEDIHDLVVLDEDYVIIATATAIKQFDVGVGKVIGNFKVDMKGKKIGLVAGRFVCVYWVGSGTEVNVYGVNRWYKYTQSGGCYQGYYLTNGYCYKAPTNTNYTTFNFTNAISPVSLTNSTLSPSQTNLTSDNSSSNTSNTSNPSATLSPQPQPFPQPPPQSSPQPQSQPQPQTLLPQNSAVTKAVGKSLIISSFKMTPNFFLSFLILLDDFEYYRFHRYQYPEAIRAFMSQVEIINTERLNPDFSEFLDVLTAQTVAISENKRAIQSFSYHQNNPQNLYFLHSTEPIYKTNTILNLTLYLLTKLLLQVLRYLSKKSKKFLKIYCYFLCSTRWWSLVLAIIETNLIKLSFYCTLQVLVCGFYCGFDRVNFGGMVIGWGIGVVYSVGFYPMVYGHVQKKAAVTILVRSVYSMNSFFLESFCVLLRNFTRAFFHAIFIQNYSKQIMALTISDAIFIILILIFRKNFLNKFVFVFFLIYQIIFFILDSIFLSNTRNYLTLDENLYDLVTYILIISIVCVSILLSFSILIPTVYDFLVENSTFFKKPSTSQKQITGSEVKPSIKNSVSEIQIPVEPLQMKDDTQVFKMFSSQGQRSGQVGQTEEMDFLRVGHGGSGKVESKVKSKSNQKLRNIGESEFYQNFLFNADSRPHTQSKIKKCKQNNNFIQETQTKQIRSDKHRYLGKRKIPKIEPPTSPSSTE